MQTTGIKVYMYFQWWHDCFCIIQEKKHFIKQKADKSLQHNSFDESQFNL